MARIMRDGDDIVVQFEPEERVPIASLAASLVEMLEPPPSPSAADDDPLAQLVGLGSDEPVEAPVDPALRRLLPDAYDDPDGAAEFRRLTDTSLRAEKVANLRRILDGVATASGVVRVGPDEIDAWLAGITDIRLALGERLAITEDNEHLADLDDGDPRLPPMAAYDLLTELQEWMVYLVTSAD